jgi:hypothetical protein
MGSSVSPLLQDLARSQVTSVTHFLRQLPGGRDIVYDGEDREWLLALTSETKRSIDAVSFATSGGSGGGSELDGGLWVSDLGARYLDRQREAISRGISIRRILVYDDPLTARDESFLRISQAQRFAGIDIRVLHHQRIPDWLRWIVSDFIIFDSTVSYETSIHAGGSKSASIRTLLCSRQTRIRDLAEHFSQLWRTADPDPQAIS